MSYSKYKNKWTIVDGIKFQSIKEGNRYAELKMLEKAGIIKDLKLQPVFELCGPVMFNGKKLTARKFKADFQYYDISFKRETVEDCKGFLNDLYKLKRSIFLNLYPQYYFIET